MAQMKLCTDCCKPFEAPQYRSKRCKACTNAYEQKRRSIGKKTCVVCKEEFTPISRGQGRRCRNCLSAQQRERRRVMEGLNAAAVPWLSKDWSGKEQVSQQAHVR